MEWGNGVGLLGLSGKYGGISDSDRDEALDFVISSFDYVDTASVYGEVTPTNEEFVKRLKLANTQPKIINKIGADLLECSELQPLLDEFQQQEAIFGDIETSALLLHRPALHLLDRDEAFYHFVKKQYPELKFGICTNSIAVLDAYCQRLDLDILQIAINLLDYQANLATLERAKAHNLRVFARSALSSGLLSGKYSDVASCQFTDPLRARFHHTDKNEKILAERLHKSADIKGFFNEFCSSVEPQDRPGNLSSFVYELTKASPLIDEVIKGGSNLSQLKENAFTFKISSQSLIDQVYLNLITGWASPYL